MDKVSLIPVRLPLIDLGRHLESEPDTSLEADPLNDLLTTWIQRKYGQDSVPYKLTSDARQSGLKNMGRRNSVSSQGSSSMTAEKLFDPTSSMSSAFKKLDQETVSGLFLLFDALDEASSFKGAIME